MSDRVRKKRKLRGRWPVGRFGQIWIHGGHFPYLYLPTLPTYLPWWPYGPKISPDGNSGSRISHRPQPLGAHRAPSPPHRHLTWHPMTHPRDQNTFFLRFEHPHTLFYPFWTLLEKSKIFIFFSKILKFFQREVPCGSKICSLFLQRNFQFWKFLPTQNFDFFAGVWHGN